MLTAQAPPHPEPVPPHLVRLTLLVAAIASGTNALGQAFSPYLLVRYPLLLVGISPEWRHIVMAVGQVDPVWLTVVAVARRVLSMISTWALGYVYGFSVVRWMERRYPRIGSKVRWVEAFYARVGPVVLLLFPGYTVSALAGAARTGWRLFVPATVLGQVLWVVVNVWIGEAVSRWTTPMLNWLEAHVIGATLVAMALVGTQQLISRLRKRDAT